MPWHGQPSPSLCHPQLCFHRATVGQICSRAGDTSPGDCPPSGGFPGGDKAGDSPEKSLVGFTLLWQFLFFLSKHLPVPCSVLVKRRLDGSQAMMESTEISAKVAVAGVSGASLFLSANPATKPKPWAGVSIDPSN